MRGTATDAALDDVLLRGTAESRLTRTLLTRVGPKIRRCPPRSRRTPGLSVEAHFRFVQPEGWADQETRPAVVLLPGMGEFRYMRRFEGVALPLAEVTFDAFALLALGGIVSCC